MGAMRTRLLVALLSLSAGACRTARPGAAPSSAVPGCSASLTGTWHDSDDASYAYQVQDSGARVVARPFTPGRAPAADAPQLVIDLSRTPSGLSGVTRETAPFSFPDGTRRTCTVEFATRIVSCEPRRLEIEVEQSGSVLPDCRRLAADQADLARHTWLRD